ncbi:MAG: TerC/Alx family metal homeostasis membrane protein [Rhodospirillales bacterium]|nr:TerC/Alx family metal homeostasis membrane protein [Rhodospirillales bacterium]
MGNSLSFLSHMSDTTMWIIFGIAVVILLAWDLFFLNRKNEVPVFSHTLLLCIVYIAAGLLFGLFIMYEHGTNDGMLFFTGFLVEKSLSLDNIFIMSVVFTSLGIPRIYQHRVLFWGILGAIVMRAILILVGETLISNFHWVLYLFSAFLLYTGIKMVLPQKEEGKFEDSTLYKTLNRFFHVTSIHSGHFFVKENGKHYITPLFFALLTIEIMDVIFALDSIPAIFLITQDIFIVYTSNIFAILGLRALYFLLEAAVHKFYYLKPALSVIMIFIGIKIFLPHIGWEVTPLQSLCVTFSVIFVGIAASLLRKTPQIEG